MKKAKPVAPKDVFVPAARIAPIVDDMLDKHAQKRLLKTKRTRIIPSRTAPTYAAQLIALLDTLTGRDKKAQISLRKAVRLAHKVNRIERVAREVSITVQLSNYVGSSSPLYVHLMELEKSL